MNFLLAIVRWLTFATFTAHGIDVNCLTQFAAFKADTPQLEEMAGVTYGKLWDQLGAKATPELMQAIAEKGNPFHLGAAGERDLYPLQRKLAEFKELLDKSQVSPERTRERFIALLKARATAVREKGRETEVAVDRARPDRTIPYRNDGSYYAVSPDAQWVALFDTPTDLTIFNVASGQSKTYSFPPGSVRASAVYFSPNGKSLFFTENAVKVSTVPFTAGVPDFSKIVFIGEVDETAVSLFDFRSGSSRNVTYAKTGLTKVIRFDLDGKTAATADIASVTKAGEAMAHWGPLEHEDGIFVAFTSHRNGTERLEKFWIEPDGKLTSLGSMGEWKMATPHDPNLRSDRAVLKQVAGGGYYFLAGGQVQLQRDSGSAPVVLFKLDDVPAPESAKQRSGILVGRPYHDQLALYHTDGNGKYTHVQLVDENTGKVINVVPIPKDVAKLEFSADGRAIHFKQGWSPNAKIHVINPDRLAEP